MAYQFLSRVMDRAELFAGRGTVIGRYLLNTGILQITEGEYRGQFAVPKWHELDKRFQLLPTIYQVHRQVVHILAGYNLPFYGEKTVMKKAIKAARELNLAIIGLRKGNIEEYLDILTEKVEEIFLIVGRVRDETKKDGLRVIESIPSGADCLGRVNPGALRARSVASVNRWQQRTVDIAQIESSIVYRLLASKAVFDFAEYTISSACHFLRAILDYCLVHRNKVLKRVQERIAGRLHAIISDLQVITFQPFLANCELGIEELDQACHLIRVDRMEAAIALISRSYNSLLLKEVQGKVEDLIMEINFVIDSQLSSLKTPDLLSRTAKGIYEEARKIDETNFRKKCLHEALAQIGLAYALLEEARLAEAKETLKKASCKITWYDHS